MIFLEVESFLLNELLIFDKIMCLTSYFFSLKELKTPTHCLVVMLFILKTCALLKQWKHNLQKKYLLFGEYMFEVCLFLLYLMIKKNCDFLRFFYHD